MSHMTLSYESLFRYLLHLPILTVCNAFFWGGVAVAVDYAIISVGGMPSAMVISVWV